MKNVNFQRNSNTNNCSNSNNANDDEWKNYEYILKKDKWLMPNLAYMNRFDTKYFNKGSKSLDLNLDYWLNKKNGKTTFQRNGNFSVFSTGIRSCPGETLAMKEMYTILANLLLNYQFIGPNGKNQDFDIPLDESFLTQIKPDPGLTIVPRYH